MVKFLEDLLQKKTKDKQSEILLARWNYDKKIIPSALQSITNLFPHYSLHDESHSITIINNIVRVIGEETFEKLSAIDIWLILEAAYIHDIGMVVSGDKLKETINSNEFIIFFKDIINNDRHSLHSFSTSFEIINNAIHVKEKLYSIETNDGFKFILAEYFRVIHASRSEEIISNPINDIGLSSPIGIIPARINKILAKICSCHTKDFNDVLKLPFSEVGIDTENAHPRFIACLLRIGDLLDLDNNRFSEVMLRTLTKVPIDTLNHKSKHLSIESLRIDRECISIKAVCDNYEVASITQHWFNYLNSEINNQMNKWNMIVPSHDFGYLPTIDKLTVELINYEFIDGKNKPQFKVDSENALALLQGAGLYDGPYQCLRELLQNAVDSTLIRIWLENKNEYKFEYPNDKNFLDIALKLPINIMIEDDGRDSQWKKWKITIEDKGTGISSEDLKYLMNTGSSSRNKARRKIIDEMPLWMKPSGTFGIGFQSVFLLTDQVNIETKSIITEEFKNIELNGPKSTKNGDILIKKQKNEYSIKHGAKIQFIHKTEAIPSVWSIKSSHKNASRAAHNFDPFIHESMDIEMGRIVDQVLVFAEKCPIPIHLTHKGEFFKISNGVNNNFDFFDEDSSLELNVSVANRNRSSSDVYYKGQSAECKTSFYFLCFEVNINGDKASDVLTLNRNKVRDEYLFKLDNEVFLAAFKNIISNFDKLFNSEREKSFASMFLHYYSEKENLKGFNIDEFNQWQNFEISLEVGKIRMKDLLDKIETVQLVYCGNKDHMSGDLYRLNGNKLDLLLTHGGIQFHFTYFFLTKVKSKLKNIFVENILKHDSRKISLTSNEVDDIISEEDLKKLVSSLKNSGSARTIIPCISKYSNLKLKDSAQENYVFHYSLDYEIKFNYPKMLSPFISVKADKTTTLKKELNEKLYNWVFENRYNENVTKQDIIQSYESFCEGFDLNEINKPKSQKV